MCDTCGCGHDSKDVKISRPGENDQNAVIPRSRNHPHTHDRPHSHDHQHTHDHHDMQEHHQHDFSSQRRISLEEDILGQNHLNAERNRGYFEAKGVVVINLMSSPGSGKTTLLEKSIPILRAKRPVAVIGGDQQTLNDAERIDKAGAPVVQINTGFGCHLDAEMVRNAAKKLELEKDSVLFIENVGNLVCPSLFELGEQLRAVIISVTEGADKPLKYPTIFERADLCIINKTDLLPYVDFKVEEVRSNALMVNPNLHFIELSAKTGEGMDQWAEWILSLSPEH